MSYEDEMEDYHNEKLQIMDCKYTLLVSAGSYTSNSLIGLMWEVFTHRCSHLLKHGRWVD